MVLWLGNYSFGLFCWETPCDDATQICGSDGVSCVAKPSSSSTPSSSSCSITTCNPTTNNSKCVNSTCTSCNTKWVCCGVKLNTSIPFIGNCIESNSDAVWVWEEAAAVWSKAFPVLMGSLTKILVTVILITSFVLIVIGGVMIATGDRDWGKKMIINVIIGIALLGSSGVILRLINPNFFQ